MFVDCAADPRKTLAVVVDAKTDYPSACNAAETLLLHERTLASGLADRVLRALRAAGVTLYGGPRAMAAGLTEQVASDLGTEYGSLSMTVEVVSGVHEAVQHIHTYGRYYLLHGRHLLCSKHKLYLFACTVDTPRSY